MKNFLALVAVAGRHRGRAFALLALCAPIVLATGCAGRNPIGATQVTPRVAYQQTDQTVLNSGRLSAETISQLHRHNLERVLADDPIGTLTNLHAKATASGERDLLFALSELSYYTAERVRKSVVGWDSRDPRDYYLGTAVYAYLFLFGPSETPPPDGFDRRFRTACELYNLGLGQAFGDRRSTNAAVQLAAGPRRLPVGELNIAYDPASAPWPTNGVQQVLMADKFRVRGFSVRNRVAGVGTPLIAIGQKDPNLRLRRAMPVTALLRVESSLAHLACGPGAATLELHTPHERSAVTINEREVPLESDLTATRAYMLNQPFAWDLKNLMFFSADRALKSQLLFSEPYKPGRIPVVLVHGTYSGPVTWAETVNTLYADRELRERCQFWLFLYSSSKAIAFSAHELRDELTRTVQQLDPEGKDPALRQVVVIGHSQGGLLTKLTATDTGEQLWRSVSPTPIAGLPVSEADRASIRQLAVFEPLPFVSRVVFISTPHRGSYRVNGLVRKLARATIELPGNAMRRATDYTGLTSSEIPELLRGKMVTSIDGMSPKNPTVLKLAEIPVAPGIKSHSIIPVRGEDDPKLGNDGVVTYASAHVDYVDSELIVSAGHSCQSLPPAIEELRRILHEHLDSLPAAQP
jgi:pimeloyl-ACP methyl ester carboxylesterase